MPLHLGDPNSTPLLWAHELQEDRDLPRRDTCALPVAVLRRSPTADRRLGLAIEKRRYRTADLVIAISDATREDACTLLGVPPERIVRVYNGVDVDGWASRRPSKPSPCSFATVWPIGRSCSTSARSDWHKNIEGHAGRLRERQREEPRHAGLGRQARRRGEDGACWHLPSALGIAMPFDSSFRDDAELAVLFEPRGRSSCLLVRGIRPPVVEAMGGGVSGRHDARRLTRRGSGRRGFSTAAPDDHPAIAAAIERLVSDGDLRAVLAGRRRERARDFHGGCKAEAMAERTASSLGL